MKRAAPIGAARFIIEACRSVQGQDGEIVNFPEVIDAATGLVVDAISE